MNYSDLKKSLARAVLHIGVFSALINVLMLVMPLYLLQVYDRVLTSSSGETLLYISIVAAGAVAFIAFLEAVRARFANRIANRMELTLQPKLMKLAIDPRNVSGNVSLLRDLQSVRSFIDSRALFILFDLPFAPFFVAMLFFVHPMLGAVTCVGAAVLVVLAIVSDRAVRKSNAYTHAIASTGLVDAASLARNGDTVRALGMTNNVVSRWAERASRGVNAANNGSSRLSALSALSKMLRIGLQIAILGVGAYYVLQGEMTAGMIFACSLISGKALQPMDQAIGAWRQILQARAAWNNVSRAASVDLDKDRIVRDRPQGRIQMEKFGHAVRRSNNTMRPVLQNINLDIPAGTVVAVAGPSGSGKSTLLRAIAGVLPETVGSLRVDGTELANWDSEALGAAIGYVPQNVELLPGTVKDNIARFDANADDVAIIDAAKKAEVHQVIETLDQSYDTFIRAGSAEISGGQRQQIALARAFYGNPSILLLDEPNTNLDDDGQAAFRKAIANAADENVTVLIVTHSLSIARLASRMIYMEQGQVALYGPTDEVITKIRAAKGVAPAQAAAPEKDVVTPLHGASTWRGRVQ